MTIDELIQLRDAREAAHNRYYKLLLSQQFQEENMEEVRLPRWADKHLDGELELYAQLATRDGRRMGNGIIVHLIKREVLGSELILYAVLTDFGNVVYLFQNHLLETFYPPVWRMKRELVEFRQQHMKGYLDKELEVLYEKS